VKKPNGFTLIELMIVVAVIAALAVIAIPSYLSQTRKARRSEVEGGIQQIALYEERFRADCSTYASAFSATCPGATTIVFPALTASYTGAYYTVAPPAGTATGYKITATAKSTGGQNKDKASGTSCSTLYYVFGQDTATDTACALTGTNVTAAGKITSCPLACWAK